MPPSHTTQNHHHSHHSPNHTSYTTNTKCKELHTGNSNLDTSSSPLQSPLSQFNLFNTRLGLCFHHFKSPHQVQPFNTVPTSTVAAAAATTQPRRLQCRVNVAANPTKKKVKVFNVSPRLLVTHKKKKK